MSTLGRGGGGGDDRRVVLLRNVPSPLRSSLMAARDCAFSLPPFHFGKAPNVSIVGSGEESGGREGGADKAQTGAQTSRKYGIVGSNSRRSKTLRQSFARLGPSRERTLAAILYAQDCLSAASPNPFGRRTSDKKASNGFRRSNHVLRTAHKNTPVNRISIDRPAGA